MYQVQEVKQGDDLDGLTESLESLAPVGADPDKVAARVHLRRWDGVRTLVCRDAQGKVVGTLSFFVEPKVIHGLGKASHIEDVAVHPDNQKKGIGQSLVREAVALAKKAGCYKAVLHCAEDTAPFYEKAGFHRAGVVMRADL